MVTCNVQLRIMFVGSIVPCGCAFCCSPGPRSRNTWYDKYFAYNMAVGMAEYEEAVAPVKRQLFSELTDDVSIHTVLEVGMGTGKYMLLLLLTATGNLFIGWRLFCMPTVKLCGQFLHQKFHILQHVTLFTFHIPNRSDPTCNIFKPHHKHSLH